MAQASGDSREGGKPVFAVAELAARNWIPAFAAMTSRMGIGREFPLGPFGAA
jgi:hypothetical protein